MAQGIDGLQRQPILVKENRGGYASGVDDVEGTVKVSKGSVEVLSNFVVKPEDYKITIPSLVKDNICLLYTSRCV